MFALAILAACASGEAIVDEEDAGTIARPADAARLPDANRTPESLPDVGPMCGACTANDDCYQTCGSPPEGMAWCCDIPMSSCYPAQACVDPDAGGTD
jgi:hypothetical protein